MIYLFLCEDCNWLVDVERDVDQCAEPAACPECAEPMRRIFTPPALLGRQKPRGFKFDVRKMDAWDDRLHHMRWLENTGDKKKQHEFQKAMGPRLYNQILQHKKERYAS